MNMRVPKTVDTESVGDTVDAVRVNALLPGPILTGF